MRKFFWAFLSVVLLSTPAEAIAFGQNDVPIDMAERGITLVVSPEGCVVNVTTAQITAIALSDRSRFVYSQVQNSVYLRPIQRQEFEGVVSMSDGTSTLRIWVGNKILRFKIRYASSGSRDVNIVEKTQFVALPKASRTASLPLLSTPLLSPKPIAPVKAQPTTPPLAVTETFPLLPPNGQVSPKNNPSTLSNRPTVKIFKKKKVENPPVPADMGASGNPPVVSNSEAVQQRAKNLAFSSPKNQNVATALLKGLNVARLNGQIRYRSVKWNRVQDVLYLIRKGNRLETAILRSGADKKTVKTLIRLGGIDV